MGYMFTEVFVAGENGYACFRIPAVISLPKQGLLAFAEGRKNNCDDHGYVDIVSKRSINGGASWDDFLVVWSNSSDVVTNTIGNPAPVALSSSGRVGLAFSRNNAEVWWMESLDGGSTWQTPKNISKNTVPSTWTWVATGPPGSLLLQSGRIVVPSYHTVDERTGIHAMFSDDGGDTWSNGELQDQGGENQAVQLNNGTVLFGARSNRNGPKRGFSYSDNGGTNLTALEWFPSLVDPKCEGSILHDPATDSIYISNPFSESSRENMTIHQSSDGGATWKILTNIFPGPSAYSALVNIDNTTAAILFERSDTRLYGNLSFTTFHKN